MARQRFFSDREFWQCAIAFADIHNTLDEIFRRGIGIFVMTNYFKRDLFFYVLMLATWLLTNICQALLCWGEWELDEPNVEPDDEPSPEAHFFEAGWGWRSFRNLCKIMILSSIGFQLNLLSILKRQMLRLCDPPWNQSMVCSWRRDMNTLETSCNSASSLSSSSC